MEKLAESKVLEAEARDALTKSGDELQQKMAQQIAAHEAEREAQARRSLFKLSFSLAFVSSRPLSIPFCEPVAKAWGGTKAFMG